MDTCQRTPQKRRGAISAEVYTEEEVKCAYWCVSEFIPKNPDSSQMPLINVLDSTATEIALCYLINVIDLGRF